MGLTVCLFITLGGALPAIILLLLLWAIYWKKYNPLIWMTAFIWTDSQFAQAYTDSPALISGSAFRTGSTQYSPEEAVLGAGHGFDWPGQTAPETKSSKHERTCRPAGCVRQNTRPG